jgi:glucan phosphoethanolaminetransferase (alkaline phosphatase superfamily)
MAHLSYYGTQILPSEIYLLFTQGSEIGGTLTQELHHIYIPVLFTLIPMGISLFFYRKFKPTYSFRFITVLVALYFLYNPVRTYITGNTWGRQPSTRELAGMNVYLSLSYFTGKILPNKLSSHQNSHEKNDSLNLVLTPGQITDWDNVVVVLGESLSAKHMSLFNYPLETTPYLNTLKDTPNFFHTTGISSGVSTDISVAFFLNLGYGDSGAQKAAKGEHCLFQLAKKNGFSTHFFSVQSGEQLRYIAPYLCTAFLDDYRSLEAISPSTVNPNAAIDRDLLPKFKDVLQSPQKRFIILHQRGSHAPWKLRFTPEAEKFKTNQTDSRVVDYDNSVVEFDLFWKELDTILKDSKSKTLVIYLSDHGESLGEDQRFGHGFLARSAFEVPMMIQAFNHPLPVNTKNLPLHLTQYNLSLYIANQLGWATNQDPLDLPKDYTVYGNDIDGFAGKAKIIFGAQNSYEFKVDP